MNLLFADLLQLKYLKKITIRKFHAFIFQKKKHRTGLVVGLIVAGAVLLAAGVVAAQYFGALQIPFLNPVSDMIHSVMS